MECYSLSFASEPTLQSMLNTLIEWKELDIAFTFDKGKDGSRFGNAVFVPYSLFCTFAGSNDINDILQILGPACCKFQELGTGLNLEGSVMEVILYEARTSSPYVSLTRVLTKWLTWNYPHQTFGLPSLSLLVKAIDTYGHQLAVKVFQTFTAAASKSIFSF